MVLKRKRSSSELCSSPSCGSSTSSSPPGQNGFNFSMMGASTTPSHQSGRTMKRLRNNRPTEASVHRESFAGYLRDIQRSHADAERTLGLLYSAQQRPSYVQDMMDDTPMEAPAVNNAPAPQQSLHRFWNINSKPVSSPALPEQPLPQSTDCDDCGASLSDGDDGMELDGYGGYDSTCGACGKHVCFSCSVSNLGEQRRCLHCAGRKAWVGAFGWGHTRVFA